MRVVLDPVKKPDTMEPEDGEEGRWGAGGAIVVARALWWVSRWIQMFPPHNVVGVLFR